VKIQLTYIGRDKKNLYADAESTFVKRIKNYHKDFRINAITPPSYSNSMTGSQIQEKEGIMLTEKIDFNKGQILLLDEKGKSYTSEKFASFLNNKMNLSQDIHFIIGGAYGFSEKTKQKASNLIALSSMTMPHHLARVVLIEQIYRAYTILRNENYHNI